MPESSFGVKEKDALIWSWKMGSLGAYQELGELLDPIDVRLVDPNIADHPTANALCGRIRKPLKDLPKLSN
jgi:hypothetical protein